MGEVILENQVTKYSPSEILTFLISISEQEQSCIAGLTVSDLGSHPATGIQPASVFDARDNVITLEAIRS